MKLNYVSVGNCYNSEKLPAELTVESSLIRKNVCVSKSANIEYF